MCAVGQRDPDPCFHLQDICVWWIDVHLAAIREGVIPDERRVRHLLASLSVHPANDLRAWTHVDLRHRSQKLSTCTAR